jgi:aminomuconate-semialdehyde/2-hydroxymuconate-6-semialdehyde dehydrogenase
MSAEKTALGLTALSNFIGGEFLSARNGRAFDKCSPATGEPALSIPDSDSADIELAVAAANAAFPAWSALSVGQRAEWLFKLAHAIRDRLEGLAFAETVDNGKPISVSRMVDVPRSALNFEFFAEAITQFASESHHAERGVVNYTLRQPLGVVGCISPWNLPLYLLSWKIAPALAAGNTVVAKPSEVTPLTAHHLAKICADIGFPKGVLNIVHGRGATAGAALCAHPGVKAVSFTGSTRTGGEIARVCASQFKKVSLELGGKNPTIVFSDCEFDRTVDEVLRASFSNQGQICLCGSRILVQRKIYDRFRDALAAGVRALQPGNPLDESTKQGALVSREHLEKVMGAIEQAKTLGGKILAGGRRAQLAGALAGGYFVEPTLIEGLSPECVTNQEEIFGPVATLIPFETEEEALAIANGVRYGLAASVWTSNLSTAHRMASRLEAGIVWINCWMLRDLRTPFGGWKESGVGREGGLEALRFFTEPKNVCVQFSTVPGA